MSALSTISSDFSIDTDLRTHNAAHRYMAGISMCIQAKDIYGLWHIEYIYGCSSGFCEQVGAHRYDHSSRRLSVTFGYIGFFVIRVACFEQGEDRIPEEGQFVKSFLADEVIQFWCQKRQRICEYARFWSTFWPAGNQLFSFLFENKAKRWQQSSLID